MDGSEPETCRRCGFDSRQWRLRDAKAVLDLLGYWWRHAVAGMDIEQLNRRPAPDVWSALEYGLHSAMVLPILGDGIERILARDRVEVPDPCPEVDTEDASRPLTLDPDSIVADLRREGEALSRLVDADHEGWHHVGLMDDGTWWQAEATLMHAIHDTTHHFLDVGEGLVRVGAAGPPLEATVTSLNVSGGGVPKSPVQAFSVQSSGVEGDRQADRKHHGRPFQAVCLWSAEAIAELAELGHPIAAGSAGENITVSGADWTRLRPGTRIRVGTALLELSYPATPCRKQARWFLDGDISRLSHAEHPEWARWYAWVRRPGRVRVGDPAVVAAPVQ